VGNARERAMQLQRDAAAHEALLKRRVGWGKLHMGGSLAAGLLDWALAF
jgi:hypothetical protein